MIATVSAAFADASKTPETGLTTNPDIPLMVPLMNPVTPSFYDSR